MRGTGSGSERSRGRLPGLAVGPRYTFEVIFETPEAFVTQSDRVRAEDLFGEDITLLSTELLERVEMEAFAYK